MSSFDKLRLLIWKNFLLQRRHRYQSLFEILSPVIFCSFLILVRCLVEPQSMPDVEYSRFQPTFFDMSDSRVLTNLTKSTRKGTVAFSPENALTKQVIKNAIGAVAADDFYQIFILLIGLQMPEPIGFKNAAELEQALTNQNAMNTYLCGVQFDDNMAGATVWPDNINVSLRFPAVMRTPMVEHPLRASWRTNLLFPVFPRPGPRDPNNTYGGKTPGYSPEFFLAIQHTVTQEIIKSKTGESVLPKVYMRRFPQISYREDNLLVALERFISMIIMLSFAYTFVNTVRVVTAEKELQLKETMKIMGLPSWLHWLAWFIKQFSYLFISIIIVVLIMKVPFGSNKYGQQYAILTFTPWSVVLFLMTLFIIASLAFCFMVSVFFTKANTAASFMGLAWFTTYAIFMLTQVLYENISQTTKILLSLISNTAMGYAFQMVVMCEGNSRGLQWSDFFRPVSYQDQFQPGHVALMLVLDTILYMLVAMYVEKIRPGSYGVPLPWYFPFTRSFWVPSSTKVGDIADSEYADSLLKIIHDEEPQGVPIGVNIQNLMKVYRRGQKRAVDNLNLRMYENEITVLLGHNGAGKTTTLSMLTGMIAPTSGTARINGFNIVTETEEARKSLGLCPQHNVLFPDLTVAEHIIFYSRLKGVPYSNIDAEVNHFVKLLDLEEKRNVISSHLSGGQKRRLSVGAAMCGSSRVVLLDEPTSGLDPAARRALWDLLQKEKKGRTIILTTHFMDEADVLGDRIAIMSGGKLQCVGTPYFLKKYYGVGYKLTMVKGATCDTNKCTTFLREHVADVNENSDIGSELTYILPNESVAKFPEMLKKLEEEKEFLAISSYGLSVTTLEEVFMKVGAEDVMETGGSGKMSGSYRNGKNHHEVTFAGESGLIHKVRGFRLLRNHIKAMFLKLAYSTIRSNLQNVIQFVSPVINISISVLIARTWKFMANLPPLELALTSGFKETQTLMSHALELKPGSIEYNTMLAYKGYFLNSTYPDMDLVDLANDSIPAFYRSLSTKNLARVRYENLIGASFSPSSITAWFSNYGYHDSAIALATVNNAMLQGLSPGSSIHVSNHPLPYSIENLVRVMSTGGSLGFQFAFNIGFCMAFVSAFIVLFVIKERTSGAKLLQRVSGVRPGILWGCAFAWDWLWMLLIHICIIITLACFQENTFSTPSELGRIFLVLIVFSVAIIPVHYLISFCFDAPATGFSKMCFINMFSGCMPFLVTEVLRLPELGSPFYAKIFDWIFSPLPIYCISRSFRDMSMSSFAILACDQLCDQFLSIQNCTRTLICKQMNISVCCIEDDPYLKWAEPGIGRYLFMMCLVGVTCFTILLVKEYELLNKFFYASKEPPPATLPEDEDSDVSHERQAILALTCSELAQHSLITRDLTKYYKKFLAVNRLSFGVRKGECFGLLGINGAGKTSTFKMLTGDTHISSGEAFVHGLSIKTNLQEVYRNIGYCPQFDGLLENLSGRETLRIYCLLRGIPSSTGAQSALALTESLGFIRHYDKKVHEYSGGTKRKLSTALALLGDAPLVFLDEPTTGMDPASKRLVWSSIGGAASERSVVLTSHSMEECEALCSRLTVMVGGRLHCLGSLQHLKNKFSQGYTLIVKCKLGPQRDAAVAAVDRYVLDNFRDAKMIETYLGISTYYMSDADLPWWKVFEIMESARAQFDIEDYSVTQTTLEQVFLRFTRLHATTEE